MPDNVAETEYIFMGFVRGTKLSDVWFDLGEQISSVLRQLAQLESRMMSISFPAGVLYTRPGEGGLEDKRFCVGPDARLPMWYGRRMWTGDHVRRSLPFFRFIMPLNQPISTEESAEGALVAAARKELAYLE
jgi:hypothetical protein